MEAPATQRPPIEEDEEEDDDALAVASLKTRRAASYAEVCRARTAPTNWSGWRRIWRGRLWHEQRERAGKLPK